MAFIAPEAQGRLRPRAERAINAIHPSARDITSLYPEGIDTRKRRVGNDINGASAT